MSCARPDCQWAAVAPTTKEGTAHSGAPLHSVLEDVLLDVRDASTPTAAIVRVVIVLGLDVGQERLEVLRVLLSHSCQRHCSRVLLVHQRTQ
eukprot:6700891-Heterocapsa_arctica.AAC.1